MKVDQEEYGKVGSSIVYAYTARNSNGVEVTCINYGGRITQIKTPDKDGNIENIVLGYDTLEEYIKDTSYLGAICGRTSGRISGASFELDGQTYQLEKNNGNNHLHGGINNFSFAIWKANIIEKENEAGVELSYFSKDGEEGYPGNLEIKVTYLLNEQNELVIFYEGSPDKKTLINMTNHSYFNLSGEAKRTVLNHTLKINSAKFAELNEEALPTGKLLDVDGTPFDLRNGEMIKEQFSKKHPQLAYEDGYNHPFLLTTHYDSEIVLQDEMSGRILIVETDQPSVVVYSSNFFDNTFSVRGVSAEKYLGICLETQGLPDAIHHEHFPQVVVDKGKVYRTRTKYIFSAK